MWVRAGDRFSVVSPFSGTKRWWGPAEGNGRGRGSLRSGPFRLKYKHHLLPPYNLAGDFAFLSLSFFINKMGPFGSCKDDVWRAAARFWHRVGAQYMLAVTVFH